MEALTPWVNQGLLIRHLNSIFKGEEIHVNSKSQSNVKYPSGTFLELDAWIPSKDIAFEFQDDYHYITTWYSNMDKDKIQTRDNVKTNTMREKEVTLVLVPCWWDGRLESLSATISFQRPDLLSRNECTSPISSNPPRGYFAPKDIPSIGELMLASFPEANDFKITAFKTAWWLGEKYDGVRFCWNPELQQIYTRSGRALNLSSSISASLPSIFVDGEFWFGRGLFSLTHMILIGASELVYWHTLRLIAFDAPSLDIRTTPFEERYSLVLDHAPASHPLLVIAMRTLCLSREHLNKTAQGIIDEAGEGVIMRVVGSQYIPGRNPMLVKLKTVFQDTEGIVVSIDAQNSAKLKLPNGKILVVPHRSILTPSLRSGDIVTFSYERHARKTDMVLNPTIVRIRTDLSWEDVVANAAKQAQYLNDHSRIGAISAQAKGEWNAKTLRANMERMARRRGLDPLLPETWLQIVPKLKRGTSGKQIKILQRLFPKLNFAAATIQGVDIESRRRFFESYAKEYQFDPLNPENWYVQPRRRIANFKGASSIIEYHKGSVSKALLSIFPDIGLDKNKLWDRVQWEDPNNRRKFFEKYAKANEFDPLRAENWYKQKLEVILSVKGISRVIFYHRSSVAQALVDLFPSLRLVKSKFSSDGSGPLLYRRSMYWDRHSWMDFAPKRKFFEDYAKDQAFDPLVAENWYLQSREKILAKKGAYGTMYYYNKSIEEALRYLFPEVKFDGSKFQLDMWKNKDKRRQFFEDYARDNNFDPLNPQDWYMQSRDKLSSTQGAHGVASYHRKKSLAKALVDLFPEVAFEVHKIFSMVDRAYQRRFFEKYAVERGFDPLNPSNWYQVRRNNLLSVRGAFAIMAHHNQSVPQALQDLFPDLQWDASKFLYLTTLRK